MATIYRKYRPQVFDEVFGQEHVIATLKKALETQRVAHAYLFTGSRGVGKTTMARLLAKAVNCLAKSDKDKPCGKCANCQAIAAGSFIDLIEIDAASNRGIDEIRSLRDKIQFSPSIGKKRVYIIDEVHMLTREAFNALLKTLEEPPIHTIFIFATTEAHKVPVTVLSRCQRFDFRLANTDLIKKSLKDIVKKEKLLMTEEVLSLVAKVSDGSFRDAQSLLDQLSSHTTKKSLTLDDAIRILNLSSSQEVERFIGYIDSKEAFQAIGLIENLKSNGVSIPDFLSMVIIEVRSSLIEQIKKGQVNKQRADFLKKLMQAQNELKLSPIESLPLELMAYDLCLEEDRSEESRIKNQEELANTTEGQGSKQAFDLGKSLNKKSDQSSQNLTAPGRAKQSDLPEASTTLQNDKKLKIENLTNDMKIAIVDATGKKKKTLGALLSDCSIEGNSDQVNIICQYPFHRDTLKSTKNLLLIEEVIDTIVRPGAKVNFEVKKEEDISGKIDSVFGGL